jgi:hypothetical protein
MESELLSDITANVHRQGMKTIIDLSTISSNADCPEALMDALIFADYCQVDGISLNNISLKNSEIVFNTIQSKNKKKFSQTIVFGKEYNLSKNFFDRRFVRTNLIYPVELISPRDEVFCAAVLHAQIRTALRTAPGCIQLWKPKERSFVTGFSNSEPSQDGEGQINHLFTVLLSCLRGAFQLDLPTGDRSEEQVGKLQRLHNWLTAIAIFQSGKITLHPSDIHVLGFSRHSPDSQVNCFFNISGSHIRKKLPNNLWNSRVISGSGLKGGRVIDHHIDLDPWGAIFLRT